MEDVIPQLRQQLATYELSIMLERIFIDNERKAVKDRVV